MIALIEGRAWATALAGSAAVVLLALTVIAFAHHQHKRDIALELILEGRERLAIAAVQHQRRRLLCQSTRTMLARNLEDIIEQATCPRTPRTRVICPLFERRVVASVEDNIRPIIRLLIADNPPRPWRRRLRAADNARMLAAVRTGCGGFAPGTRPPTRPLQRVAAC